jgi:hypothetical protein
MGWLLFGTAILVRTQERQLPKQVDTVRALLTVGFWGFRCKEPTVNSHDELTVGTRFDALAEA